MDRLARLTAPKLIKTHDPAYGRIGRLLTIRRIIEQRGTLLKKGRGLDLAHPRRGRGKVERA